MKHTTLLVGAAIAATVAITAGTAQADEKWWPAKYYNLDSGSPKIEPNIRRSKRRRSLGISACCFRT